MLTSLAYRCRMGVGKIIVPRPLLLFNPLCMCHWMAWLAHTCTKNKDKPQFVCTISYHMSAWYFSFIEKRFITYDRHVLCMNVACVYGKLFNKNNKNVWLEIVELEKY